MRGAAWFIALAACGRLQFDDVAAGDALRSDAAPGDALLGDSGPDPTLLGWWKLDEGVGATAADSSGNGNPGAFTAGCTWGSGRNSLPALDLDGTADHEVDIGDPPLLHVTGSMTVMAWVNARAFHLGTGIDDLIVSRSNVDAGDLGWELKGTEDCGPQQFALELAAAPNVGPTRCSTTVAALDTWYHVAGVYDAASRELHIYVDGALDDGMLSNVVPSMQYVPVSAVHVEIGNGVPTAGLVGGASTFNGLISDVRIYGRALDSTEIAALAR